MSEPAIQREEGVAAYLISVMWRGPLRLKHLF